LQVTPKFIIEPLDPAKHRREDFDCRVTELNAYLQRNARNHLDLERDWSQAMARLTEVYARL